VREAVRLRYRHLAPGWDVVFVVRPAAAEVTFQAIDGAVAALLSRAGLLPVEELCAGSA